MLSRPESACLLIADISGYTRYLAGSELDHAQDILADLMSTVVGALRPGFRLAKLEGDAAFAYMHHRPGRRVAAPGHHRADLLRVPATSPRHLPGDVLCLQRVRPDAPARPQAHRPPRFGHPSQDRRPGGAGRLRCDHRPSIAQEPHRGAPGRPRVRHVQQCVRDRDGGRPGRPGHDPVSRHVRRPGRDGGLRPGPLGGLGGGAAVAAHDRVGQGCRLHLRDRPPGTQGHRVVVHDRPGDPSTLASRRQGVEELPTAPRRGVGTTNHCMHGKDVLVEEILDWRPTDYVTLRTTMPNGFSAMSTYMFQDVPDGTQVRAPVHVGQEPTRA